MGGLQPRRVACQALLAGVIALLTGPAAAYSAIFWVNSTADTTSSGCPHVQEDELPDPGNLAATTCTLRSAIAGANADNGGFIGFNVTGPFFVATPLPHLGGAVYIEGGYSNPPGTVVDIVGGALGEGAPFPGMVLEGGFDDLGRLAFHGFTDGIVLAGTGDHILEEVHAGLTPSGEMPAVRNTGSGIRVLAGSARNWIGEKDYISPAWAGGNLGWGLVLEPGSGPTFVYSGRFGLNRAQTHAVPNALGGVLVQADDTVFGGTDGCTFDMPPELDQFECTITFSSGNGGPGIQLADGTANTRMASTFVGIDGAGAALGNGGDGIIAGGTANVIGQNVDHGVVVASSNAGRGIVLRGGDSTIANARVGTTTDGIGALPNQAGGILTDDSAQTTGDHRILSSVVSANGGPGIELRQAGTTIRGSAIGAAADRTTLLGNAGPGILALRGPALIGGDGSGVVAIAGNGSAGIDIRSELPGVVPRGVKLAALSVFSNAGLGVDLAGDGLTPNDPGDGDDGPNALQNAPLLNSVSSAAGKSAFHGTFDGAPNTTYDVAVYRSDTCDSGGHGEGMARVAAGFGTTNSEGIGFFGFWSPTTFGPGDVITALATSPSGDTSEFSACRIAVSGVDLTVDQSAAGERTGGSDLDVLVSIVNHGPETATNVTLTESLPSGATLLAGPSPCETTAGTLRCGIENLAPGQRAERHFIIRLGDSGELSSTASVSADEVDVNESDNSFTLPLSIAPDPRSIVPGTGTDLTTAGPVFGLTLRLDPVSGSVTATLPSGTTFPLTSFALVPVGTVVNAANGIAQVTAALPGGVGTSSGTFRDARFRLRQPVSEGGLTEARIVTPLNCTAGAAARATASAKKKKKKAQRRHLWGTVKGAFRIRGRYASGSVRGTKWRVLDTCTSTEVLVREGVVLGQALNDARPAARTIRAGQRAVFRRR